MVASRKQHLRADVTHLEIVWRNPLNLVQSRLRLREASNPYYGWAEQASKIRSRRSSWNGNRPLVA
jgi:hypothetical protein